MRKDNQARSLSGGFNSPNQNMNFGMNNMGGGFRGGRGGFNNRGGMSNMGGFGGRGGFQNTMGGFQGNPMVGGFQGNPMGGMQNYGFNNRGNMMGGGMRGGPVGMRGRGGMAGPNMMGMPAMNPMGGMGMNPMAGGMNPMMGGMGGNMGMQGASSSDRCLRDTLSSLASKDRAFSDISFTRNRRLSRPQPSFQSRLLPSKPGSQ